MDDPILPVITSSSENMFSVNPAGYLPPGMKLILKESVFARWGTEIKFDISSLVVPTPFRLIFLVQRDKNTNSPTSEKSALIDGVMKIQIKVPEQLTQPTYSKKRWYVVGLPSSVVQLSMSFMVYPLFEAEDFIFLCEFYEEPYQAPTPEGIAGGSA